jgi:hypothetical protein
MLIAITITNSQDFVTHLGSIPNYPDSPSVLRLNFVNSSLDSRSRQRPRYPSGQARQDSPLS